LEVLQREWQNRIRRAGRHQSSFHFTPIHFYRKVFFSERAGLLIIPMPRIIYPYFTVRTSPDGPNYTHFKMKNRSAYDQAFKETNDQKRFILYQKMDQIIIDEAPIIPLFYTRLQIHQKRGNRFGINR
jgi:ABC-type transport system substrate-binding protein